MVLDFGTAIKEARKSKGLTRAVVAKQARIAPSSLVTMELQDAGTVAQMQKVLEVLEIRWSGLPRGKPFGAAVRALRERKGWSQEKLCERAGVSVPALIRLEQLEAREGSVQLATLEKCLSILAPNMRVKRDKVSPWVYDSKDSRFTPPEFLTRLRKVLGKAIDCDPCGHPAAFVKAKTIYTEQDNGLAQNWRGVTYVNPPYSKMHAYLRKARKEWDAGHCELIAMLLPYRLHTFVWAETLFRVTDTFLIVGRVNFVEENGRKTSPHANTLVLFGADKAMIQRVLENFYCVHVPRSAKIGTGSVIKRAA